MWLIYHWVMMDEIRWWNDWMLLWKTNRRESIRAKEVIISDYFGRQFEVDKNESVEIEEESGRKDYIELDGERDEFGSDFGDR
jgi:hypothetical protein